MSVTLSVRELAFIFGWNFIFSVMGGFLASALMNRIRRASQRQGLEQEKK
jgi:hypothetical protein